MGNKFFLNLSKKRPFKPRDFFNFYEFLMQKHMI